MLVSPTDTPTTIHSVVNLASVLTPPLALIAAEIDYTPAGLATASVLRLTACVGGGTLSGLAAPAQGQLLLVCNISTDPIDKIVLLHEDGGSLAANRFLIGPSLVYDAVDPTDTVSFTIPPAGSVWLWYDLDSARWRKVGA